MSLYNPIIFIDPGSTKLARLKNAHSRAKVGPSIILKTSGGKATPSDLQQAGTGLTGSLSSYIKQLPTGASAPKAYSNWVLLDEQFKIAANTNGS